MKHNSLREVFNSVALTASERTSMRERVLQATAGGNILSSIQPARSPFRMKRMAALSVIVGLVTTGTGAVTYAAQSALPGNTLYAVKRVAERAHEAVIFSQVGAVKLAGKHAIRRIQEATTLRVQQSLTLAHEAELASNLQEHLSYIGDTIVASSDQDASILHEEAIVLGKVAGYANIFVQVQEVAVLDIDPGAFAVAMETGAPSPQAFTTSETAKTTVTQGITDVAESFVASHEQTLARSISREPTLAGASIVSTTGERFALQTEDPLFQATIATVVATESLRDAADKNWGEHVLRAFADMAEGEASALALASE